MGIEREEWKGEEVDGREREGGWRKREGEREGGRGIERSKRERE